ncbi:uncharacterized protein LOC133302731 [Gastrolobium bilobum]|uniref:uncharacterized protein LOC133302731 n=1 Tax=Gastrolobium bilobum TaxID=150636 RepID=UPI002AB202CA|nr:uncharacterized protein LOC133302731 [Gastrolobium bilobum]
MGQKRTRTWDWERISTASIVLNLYLFYNLYFFTVTLSEVEALYELYIKLSNSEEFHVALFRNKNMSNLFADRLKEIVVAPLHESFLVLADDIVETIVDKSCKDSEEADKVFDVVSTSLDDSSVAAFVAFVSQCCSFSPYNLDGDVSDGWIVDNTLGLPMRDVSTTDRVGEVRPLF